MKACGMHPHYSWTNMVQTKYKSLEPALHLHTRYLSIHEELIHTHIHYVMICVHAINENRDLLFNNHSR